MDYGALYNEWAASADYPTYWEYVCTCGVPLEMETQPVPEFVVLGAKPAGGE